MSQGNNSYKKTSEFKRKTTFCYDIFLFKIDVISFDAIMKTKFNTHN